MKAMRISDLARAGGVGGETVRFYQRKGLLAVPRGDAPGGRHYDEEDLRRLRYIKQAQNAGFTLAEIAQLIELSHTDDRPAARAMARERIAALDDRIAVLQAARQALVKLEHDCVQGGDGPCPILNVFEQPFVSRTPASGPAARREG
ncbi:MAG TPA: MerR family transcriptional regulator [Croceibacterium sp.]|jgi:MerR family mercuric resistance operon transcriptional regulator